MAGNNNGPLIKTARRIGLSVERIVFVDGRVTVNGASCPTRARVGNALRTKTGGRKLGVKNKATMAREKALADLVLDSKDPVSRLYTSRSRRLGGQQRNQRQQLRPLIEVEWPKAEHPRRGHQVT
jgi:hypothetical protein